MTKYSNINIEKRLENLLKGYLEVHDPICNLVNENDLSPLSLSISWRKSQWT